MAAEQATTSTTTIIARADQHDIDLHKASDRVNFGSIREPIDVPYLLGVQTDSFDWLIGNERWKQRVQEDLENGTNTVPHVSGLDEVFQEISPIENFAQTMSLTFSDPYFEEPRHTVQECKEKDYTYSAPLYVNAEFENGDTGEIKSQTVFMGDFPLQTPHGTFIIGGTERVIVSQLVRSPGVYFDRTPDRTSDKEIFGAKIIPSRGAWLEFEIDKRDVLGVRVDRKRKQSAIVFLMAIGMTKPEIREAFQGYPLVLDALDKEPIETQDEALTDLYRKIRPADTATPEAGKNLLESFYFNTKRYDLARVGRYKINRKLGLEADYNDRSLSREDIIATIKYLVTLHAGDKTFPGRRDGEDIELRVDVDDIDHFGNRRIRQVGELIQNQLRTGLSRMERVVRERMTTQDAEAITPQSLINIRPVNATIKEFFGTSQLSQFMDQNNPLAGVTNKRRLSALGPGGLSRDRASMEVRDVHPSHFGRMCPIESPEGPNIGLIGSLATFGRINPFGFIETPYRKVENGHVTDDVVYMTADREVEHVIAQANQELDENGNFISKDALVRDAAGEAEDVPVDMVDYMDVSPRQMVSVGASLIPFLEHDEGHRALMGTNMQRQAVPLIESERPLVGTGSEWRSAIDSGDVILAEKPGVVTYVSADIIRVMNDDGTTSSYKLTKFQRSNQSTCYNQVPRIKNGERVETGTVLADGPATDKGEMALGKNLLVAFMPWNGYNYEDAIIVSQRLVQDDTLSSIHIEEYEIDARETKLGAEEITRDLPNVGEDAVANLDERGIIRIGAEVEAGDILVGKVTPKGETELTPEERLLRAIFARRVRHRDRRQGDHPRRRRGGRRRAAQRREPDRARLHRPAPQDHPGRQARGPSRQQGRHLPHPAGGGYAVPGGRHPGRHHAQPAGRAEPNEPGPGARDAPGLGGPRRLGHHAGPGARGRVEEVRAAGRREGRTGHPGGDPGVRRRQAGGPARPAQEHAARPRRQQARRRERQGHAVRRPYRRTVPQADLGGLHVHAEAAPPGRRQDSRPFDRPVLDDHAAAAGRQGPVRRPALRRDGGVGPRGLRRRLHAARDDDHQVG